ncbi:MAG: DUF1826 domain-containing protein [Aliishimia sp.]
MMRKLSNDPIAGVAVQQKPEQLGVFKTPECSATIWQRQAMPNFQAWLDTLSSDNLPSTRQILQPQNVQAALCDVCDAVGLTDDPHRQHLIRDISALAHLFCDLMDAPFVRLRLDRITTNACRKFHVDAISARLVCTYRGTGTQYGVSVNDAEPADVFTVSTYSPILLRGTLWPAQPETGLLHRSPPIEGSGETRLVLVLDPIYEMHEER